MKKKKLDEAFENVGGIVTLKPIHNIDTSLTKMAKKITESPEFVNETLPAFPREWKNLEKAEAVLDKAVSSLEKAVSKKDRKSAKEISGLWKYTSKNIKKFKELLGKEVLSKLQ